MEVSYGVDTEDIRFLMLARRLINSIMDFNVIINAWSPDHVLIIPENLCSVKIFLLRRGGFRERGKSARGGGGLPSPLSCLIGRHAPGGLAFDWVKYWRVASVPRALAHGETQGRVSCLFSEAVRGMPYSLDS